VEGEAARLHLERARISASDEVDRPSWQQIVEEVDRALMDVSRIAQRPYLLRRPVDAWTGARFEAALAALHRAREGLLLIQPTSAVLARIPDLRAGVKARLPVTDPRFDGFMRLLDDLERRGSPASTAESASEPPQERVAPRPRARRGRA
jgi:hypothetical protein